MKICLLGSQGTGKSTLVNNFKDKYKVLDGIARNVLSTGGKGNKEGNVESQKRIFDDYYNALTTCTDFISTRSVIDVVAYTRYLHLHEKKWFRKLMLLFEYKRQLRKTKSWLKKYPNTAICFIPIEFELENDGVRSIDKDYQGEIEQLMFQLFDSLSIKQSWIIRGDLKSRIEQLGHIIEIVKSQDQFYSD